MTTAADVLAGLLADQPKFHPTPSGGRALEERLTREPGSRAEEYGESYALGGGVLDYLTTLDMSDLVTCEIGAGYSSVVFAATSRHHIVVNPDPGSNDKIAEYVGAIRPDAPLEFLADSSDRALPALASSGRAIDIALIDGNHSHPFPTLDFHYLDLALTVGGLMLVDDSHIPGVTELTRSLVHEPAYELEREIGTCIVYRKVADRQFGWAAQRLRTTEATDVEHMVSTLRPSVVNALQDMMAQPRASTLADRPSLSPSAPKAKADEPAGKTSAESAPSAPTPSGAAAQVIGLLRWYKSASGLLFGLSIVLLGVAAIALGWLAIPYLLGLIGLAVYTPYRSLREQRRVDRLIGMVRSQAQGAKRSADRAGKKAPAPRPSRSNTAAVEMQAVLAEDLDRRVREIETRLGSSNPT